MADDQTQQTRVLLVNGQTIILQGDAGDNSINEIHADLLQQALHEASTSTDGVDDTNEEYTSPLPETETNNDNLVAIFQGDQGETHTIQLTVEQAEALGLHFSVDGEEKPIHQDVSETSLHMGEGNNQLVYPEDPLDQHESKVLFENCVSADTPCPGDLQNEQGMESDNGSVLQTPVEGMEVLSPNVGTYIDTGSNRPITLIPQFVDGQMTYAVKLGDDQSENTVLQDHQFSTLQEDDKSGLALSPPPSTTAVATVSVTSDISSTLNSITTSPQMLSSISSSVSSIPSSQPVSVDEFQCSRTSGANISTEKQNKVSYVLVPGNNTNTNSVVTKLSSSQGTRLTESFHNLSRNQLISNNIVSSSQGTRLTETFHSTIRNQLISGNAVISNSQIKTSQNVALSAPSTGTTTQIGTVNALGGVPIVSPNLTRTSTSNSLLTSSVSTTLTGGGMIRVVAGGGSNRTGQQQSNSNGNKLSSILNPSGRLVTTNSSSGQKILSFNSSTTKPPPAATSDAVTSAVSAALTRMPVQNINSTKPLGSSENPIQLVQHGQTFHSVQALSQEQLRQIATVLQQQHLDSAPRTKNVLYDAETNTRIIYRVVYPEDLDLREPRSPPETKMVGLVSGRGRGRRGRPPKSSAKSHGRGGSESGSHRRGFHSAPATIDMDLDEDRLIDDTGKGERKKQVARTRSGRLSRPPRHMVKDYKRLHHLDFADADLDDSDGGYSDYQMSEHETEEIPEKVTPKELLPGLVVPKRKISSHFRCPTCQKIYLGHSRMARHFEMFPDHGSIDQLQTPPPNNNNNNNNNNSSNNNNNNNNSRTEVVAPPSPMEQLNTPDVSEEKFVNRSSAPNGIMRTGPSRRRGKRRGPWSYMTPESRSERRKIKLREVLATCEAEELSEVAGPAVAGVLSLWDLLVLRVEAVRTDESYVATLCDELRVLLEKVRAVVSDILLPLDPKYDSRDEQLELQDEVLCSTLGVTCGWYKVDESKLRYRLGHLDPPRKRVKMESSLQNSPKDVNEEPEGKMTCPEVLSALALDVKPCVAPVTVCSESKSSSVVDSRTSKANEKKVSESVDSDMCVEEDHQFLLTNASDMCVDELAQGAEIQTQDLQTVDDIVNERLKNLTGGNTLDFGVSVPISSCITSSVVVSKGHTQETSASDELIDTLDRFQQEGTVTSDTVASFDPEIALAAMGEGDQNVTDESAHPQYPTSLSSMDNLGNGATSSFDPEIALAAMGEGEQPPTSESSQDQFSSTLPVIESVTGNVESTFTPEMALVAMGEGEQSPVKSACSSYESSMTQLETDVSSSFNTSMDLPSLASSSQSEVHSNFPSLTRSNSVTSNTQNTFDAEMALAVMEDGEQTVDNKTVTSPFASSILTSNTNTFSTTLSNITENERMSVDSHAVENVSSFDPEIALAAMGEGDGEPSAEPSHMHFTTSLPQTESVSGNSSTFDPEMALVGMGEGTGNVRNTSQYAQQSDSVTSDTRSLVNSGTFQLPGLPDTSMDVSLDGSGPELDFEVLSEEFNRNTRHS